MTEFEVKVGPGINHETESYLLRFGPFLVLGVDFGIDLCAVDALTSNHTSMVVSGEESINLESPKRVVIIGEDRNVRESSSCDVNAGGFLRYRPLALMGLSTESGHTTGARKAQMPW